MRVKLRIRCCHKNILQSQNKINSRRMRREIGRGLRKARPYSKEPYDDHEEENLPSFVFINRIRYD